jgi:hypothetical protein
MPFVPDAVSVLQNRPPRPLRTHARTLAAALQVFVVRSQVNMQNHQCLLPVGRISGAFSPMFMLVCERRRHFLSV